MSTLDIFDIWQKLMSLCNVQQNGQIRPQTDFQNWYNTVNTEMFKAKIAKFQLNQQITDELSPFHTTAIINTTPVSGRNYMVIPLPSDYQYLIDVRAVRQKDEAKCDDIGQFPIIDGKGVFHTTDDPDYAVMIQQYAGMGIMEKTVSIIEAAKWGGCLNHPTKSPSWTDPKATQDKDGIKIAPKGVTAAVLDYFHTPRSAVFAYTIVTGDIVQYNSAGSTQLEWTSVVENEFLVRLGMKYAASIGDNTLYAQFDNQLKLLVG